VSFRCVVFAAVSSKPQAAEGKDSISEQVRRGRDFIERRGWEETREPLVVPGQTRSIAWLHEAIEEVDAIAELVGLAQRGEIDLVVVRDYDRLARKRSLLAQLTEYLLQRRVQVHALDKPVEPVPPSQLGRRSDGRHSAALIEAISGVASEEEVNRIVRRREFGMNATMKKGVRKLPETMIPFGYTRVTENDLGEEVRVDVPRVVPSEESLVKRIEDLYLSGYSYRRVCRLLNAEGIPSPRRSKWQTNTVKNILTNEFYCGFVVWGYSRSERVYDPERGDFVKKHVYAPIVQELRERTGFLPTAFDLLDYPEECERDDVVIADGEHERIRTKKRQRELFDEIAARRGMGGRAASTVGNCYLFSGVVTCDECGYSMMGRRQSRGDREYFYYYCSGRRNGVDCGNYKYAREDALYETVMEVLTEISRSPEAADHYLERQGSERRDHIVAERDRLRDALDDLGRRRERWDRAYESGAIDLDAYSERINGIEGRRDDVEYRLGRVEARATRIEEEERKREDVLDLLDDVPEPEDRQATKVYLRRVVEEIRIKDGEVSRILL
jgi:site-specific DNA recombinase